MTLIRSIAACFLLSISLMESLSAQDLLDYANSLKFADYLFNTKQYDLSSIEFERVIFLEPGDTLSKLKLIKSYRYLKKFETAKERLLILFPKGPDSMPADFSEEFMKLSFCEDNYNEGYNFLMSNKTIPPRIKAEYHLGILAAQCRWAEGKSFADQHSGFMEESGILTSLNDICIKGLNTRYKKPWLAASLSAVIPGAGKVYTGRWKDALFSFLLITGTSWFAYNSIENNGFNLESILIGTAALGFYSANIYGSYKSGNHFNQSVNQSLIDQVHALVLDEQRK